MDVAFVAGRTIDEGRKTLPQWRRTRHDDPMVTSTSAGHERPYQQDASASLGQAVWVDDLDEAVCWRLLARTVVGRVGFIDDGEPCVLPVNYGVAGDAIVFRTGSETTLHDLGDAARVAFEIDAADIKAETGWSIVVRGHLSEVVDAGERDLLAAVAIHPWAPGVRDHWMRVTPSKVTGRAISRRRSRVDGSLLPYMPPD